MNGEVDALIYTWLHDIQRWLMNCLDNLKDDLGSDDAAINARARTEAEQIMAWLFPPPPPLSAQERLRRAAAAAADPTLTEEQKQLAACRATRSTGRKRGRPRNETSQLAVRALTLFYAKGFQPGQSHNHGGTWREIARQIKPCNHEGRNEHRSCRACGDAVRDAAGRLEDFLISIGYRPAS